ncbi:hypothetical protein MVLG_06779 [Microbotryum lychnidis-dioicae p1A1 Lamole]|uniref:Small ribosomal subunit protein mS41 n=2 Tax=Microbotryum TaxID=34416 RepID=U5HIB7_USTV1|nr:hypothetical protein MVLG_06779 [Microbotryum lychnidis-dioicae p1A1 Lamole]SGY22582.1 BQ5605_C019g08822 [Microbotryum silenes-dioicae]|eukprot:KDE02691.1 hypothetical protein MVLG_06779 [Microbotryum lychnidis-dioicae p1A1 Lamole]
MASLTPALRTSLRLTRPGRSTVASASSWHTTPLASSSSQLRSLHAPALAPRRIPSTRTPYTTPAAVLESASRNLKQHTDKFPTWEALFASTSHSLAELGLAVKERRYLLWVLEKYRAGFDIAEIAVPTKPKRKIRGWGPKVQNGKRVR